MDGSGDRPARPWDGLYGPDEIAAWEAGGYGGPSRDRRASGRPDHRRHPGVHRVPRRGSPRVGQDVSPVRAAPTRGRPSPPSNACWRRVGARASRSSSPGPRSCRSSGRRPAPQEPRVGKESDETARIGHEYPPEIAPLPGELIIEKTKPSVFFGTPLLSHLQMYEVDHLLVAGTTTSGCVRASVDDVFSETSASPSRTSASSTASRPATAPTCST